MIVEDIKKLEKIFKAVANKRRLQILRFLKQQKEASVGDIAENIGVSFKSTSRHLAVLYSVDILEKEQRSLEVFYSISAEMHKLMKHVVATL